MDPTSLDESESTSAAQAPPLTRESRAPAKERSLLPWVAALCGAGGLALGLGVGLTLGVLARADVARGIPAFPPMPRFGPVPRDDARVVVPAYPDPGPVTGSGSGAFLGVPDATNPDQVRIVVNDGDCHGFSWEANGRKKWLRYGVGCDHVRDE
jgi:hypothetical protein